MNCRLRSVIIFLVCAAHENEIKKLFCNGQVLSVNDVPAYGKGRLKKVIEHLDSTVHCEAEKVQTHAESWFLWQTPIHLLTALMFNVCQVFKHLQQYSDDHPNPDVVDKELRSLKRKWMEVKDADRPDNLSKAVKLCEKEQFPNIFTLIKIGSTLPVTSAECERSFSAMRRLRTWLRSSMNSERLSALAIMHINRTVEVDYEEESRLFFALHPR